jgi:hypothetical protein
MNSPICLKCRVVMSCEKTGQDLELMSGTGPYQMWSMDCYVCKKCGAQIANTSTASKPMMEHYQPQYLEWSARLRPLRYWASWSEKEMYEKSKVRDEPAGA